MPCLMQDIAFYCLDYLFNITLLLSLDFLNQSCTIFEADLVSSSHLSSGSLTHAVEEIVEGCELCFGQRFLERNTESIELVRELGGVNIALSVVVKCINHRTISFQIQYYRKRLH